MLTADTLIHVCDSETTGLKVEEGDRIIQIAAVTGTANGGISDRYSAILDTDGRKSSPESYAIHRIAFNRPDRRPEREVMDEFLVRTRRHHVVFHNGPFDMAFIEDSIRRNGLPGHEWIIHDTMVMARNQLPGVGLSLDSIARKLNVDPFLIERRKLKHDALEDCELTFEVFRRLAFPSNLLLEQNAAAHAVAISDAPLNRVLDW